MQLRFGFQSTTVEKDQVKSKIQTCGYSRSKGRIDAALFDVAVASWPFKFSSRLRYLVNQDSYQAEEARGVYYYTDGRLTMKVGNF